MSKPFHFKQFTIHQDKCAMKVGTDGVLLGAWTSLNQHPNSILDIGSGTGIIALQMAQRSNAELIDAVELDDLAHEQTVENFENSDWADRLFCYHASLQQFAEEIEETYDLIISNPPFYTDTFKTSNDARNKARFTTSLPFEELVDAVVKLLSPNGIFSIIIPFKEEHNFVELAKKNRLHLQRTCHVKGHVNATTKRSLLEFSLCENLNPKTECLIIETKRHQYTDAYIDLVRDFYVKM